MGLADGVEDLGRGVGGHRLRQKFLREPRGEKRLDLLVRVAAGRQRRLHHQPSVGDDLRAGVAFEEVFGDQVRGNDRDCEAENQDQVELDQKRHGCPLRFDNTLPRDGANRAPVRCA
jgi:hypothetical protein